MADLDEEFARFQAELATLEEQEQATSPVDEAPSATEAPVAPSSSRKRPREDEDTCGSTPSTTTEAQPPAKQPKPSAPERPVVITAKPMIYSAPPRPAPVKNSVVGAALAAQSALAEEAARPVPARETTSEGGGALSGFPAGTTGEYAASAGSLQSMRAQAVPVQRVDMVTGELFSPEEQQLMNTQQSVYEYDPNRAARMAAAAQANAANGHGTGAAGSNGSRALGKPKRHLRMAGGEIWEDTSLADWPDNDFRLFVGDLGNEVNDEILAHAFSRFATFQRARVVRDKFTHKTRGYGFVSFADPFDCAKAMREMNGKYIGNRPVKISKSKWQDRNIDVARRKAKKKKHHLFG